MKHWVGIGILAGLLAAACGTRQAHEGGTFTPLGDTGYGGGSSHTNWLGPNHPSRLQKPPPVDSEDSLPAEIDPGDGSNPEFVLPRHRHESIEI